METSSCVGVLVMGAVVDGGCEGGDNGERERGVVRGLSKTALGDGTSLSVRRGCESGDKKKRGVVTSGLTDITNSASPVRSAVRGGGRGCGGDRRGRGRDGHTRMGRDTQRVFVLSHAPMTGVGTAVRGRGRKVSKMTYLVYNVHLSMRTSEMRTPYCTFYCPNMCVYREEEEDVVMV